jgi:hypothetical protein
MAIAPPLSVISVYAALAIGGATLLTPARGEAGAESPSSSVLPPPAVPQPAPVPPSIPAPPSLPTTPLSADPPGAIGFAEMDSNGTIRLHLRTPPRSAPGQTLRQSVPWSSPQERIGYGDIEIDRRDAHYDDMLRHLGGLAPGQIKPVPQWRADEQWHCALDPDRGPCPLDHLLPGRAALTPYRIGQASRG